VFVVAATTLCLAVATIPSAHAEVVYGNLGASGTTGTLTNSNAHVIPSSVSSTSFRLYGSAFTTPSSGLLTLESVTLGLGNTSGGTISRQIQIRLDDNNTVGQTVFATSLATNVIGTTQALYTFNFPAATNLSASTKYWIVPQTSPDYRWYMVTGNPVPTAQNNSGYVPSGAGGFRGSDGEWVSASTNSFAVSVVAVPEPAALMLATIGIVIGGVAVVRARSRSARLAG